MSEPDRERPDTGAPRFVPGDDEIEGLITRAAGHPLGLRFLLEGHLGSVATTFRTHAFTVDAARERLRREGEPSGPAARREVRGGAAAVHRPV